MNQPQPVQLQKFFSSASSMEFWNAVNNSIFTKKQPPSPLQGKIVPGMIISQRTTETTSKQLKFYQEALEAMMHGNMKGNPSWNTCLLL